MGGPFSLINETGKLTTQDDFKGRFLLLYFGYTFCPDICPSELKKMADALNLLGKRKNRNEDDIQDGVENNTLDNEPHD